MIEKIEKSEVRAREMIQRENLILHATDHGLLKSLVTH